MSGDVILSTQVSLMQIVLPEKKRVAVDQASRGGQRESLSLHEGTEAPPISRAVPNYFPIDWSSAFQVRIAAEYDSW